MFQVMPKVACFTFFIKRLHILITTIKAKHLSQLPNKKRLILGAFCKITGIFSLSLSV
jgi:hypothetical protein